MDGRAEMGVLSPGHAERFFDVSAGLPFSAGFLGSVRNEVAGIGIREIERDDICVLPLELQRDSSPQSPQPSSFGFLVLVCPSNLRTTTPRVNFERNEDGTLSLDLRGIFRGYNSAVELPPLRHLSADDAYYFNGDDSARIVGIEVPEDQIIIGQLPGDESVVSALIVAVDAEKYDEAGNSWHPGALKLRQVFAGDDEVFVARSARIPEWVVQQKESTMTRRAIINKRLEELERRNKGWKTKGEMGELRTESNKGKHKKRKNREKNARERKGRERKGRRW